ncbi:MAG: hypothetical protein QOG09_1030 [Solirubrobacterales bacterium]|jgi:hypothetical protein|nr:hypothetical protein [Solirubrobacterales bacterium]MDX6662928.1 hypothetical protein [Solirubrobacterales bacterium]
MKSKSTKLILAAAVALLALAATAVAATFTVYTNKFDTRAQVLEMKHVQQPHAGGHCSRTFSAKTMRVAIGKSTVECSYTPPVSAESGGNGGNFAVNVSSVVSKNVAQGLRKKLFTSVAVRLTDQNSKLRLDVYSSQRRFVLRHYSNNELAAEVPGTRVLASGQSNAIQRPGAKNRIRIKILQTSATTAEITIKANGHLLKPPIALSEPPNIPKGRQTSITLGRNSGSGNGAVATFDNLSIQQTF